ncbi:MAG: LysE family translocator [Steroidobacter sp.]
MTIQSYLLFVAASFVLVIVPGPDMLYMLSRCVAQGRKAGIMAALGFNVGGYVHLTAAVLGLSAVLATSSVAFMVVKWLGAGYLLYLGITTLISKDRATIIFSENGSDRTLKTIFWQAFLSDVLNPKVAMFFVALLPQFVNAKSAHPTLQIVLLGVTTCVIALPVNLLIVWASAKITATLRQNETVSRWLHRLMGAVFVALGIRLAAETD